MTQEELYWYEKRLRMKADAKEHEIREYYNFLLNRPIPQWMKESESRMREIEMEKSRLRWKCNQEIEYARLEILEPILDYEEKKRFNSLRDAREKKKQEEERKRIDEERKRLEQERIQHEREKKYKEQIQKEAQERKVRAEKEAKERAIKEAQERKNREEQAAKKRAKQKKIGCFLTFLLIVATIIVFFSVFV